MGRMHMCFRRTDESSGFKTIVLQPVCYKYMKLPAYRQYFPGRGVAYM